MFSRPRLKTLLPSLSRLAGGFLLSTVTVAAAQAAQWKDFQSTETGLVLINMELSGEALNKTSAQLLRQSTPQNLASLSQALTDLQQKLAPAILEHGSDIAQSLKSFELKSTPQYEQLESPVHLTATTNTVLKKAYFINSAVRTQSELLPVIEQKLKSSSITMEDKIALGLTTLALGHFMTRSSAYAQEVPTDIQNLSRQVASRISQTQAKITANPMSALQLGNELKFLMEAQSALGKISEMSTVNAQKLPTQVQQLAVVAQKVNRLF